MHKNSILTTSVICLTLIAVVYLFNEYYQERRLQNYQPKFKKITIQTKTLLDYREEFSKYKANVTQFFLQNKKHMNAKLFKYKQNIDKVIEHNKDLNVELSKSNENWAQNISKIKEQMNEALSKHKQNIEKVIKHNKNLHEELSKYNENWTQNISRIKDQMHMKLSRYEQNITDIIENYKAKIDKKNSAEIKEYVEYKKQRDAIIKQLPKLSERTYNTTFHVLVDSAPKMYQYRYKFIVLVSSHSGNFQRRKNIRELWANKSNWKNQMWRVFFITGGTNDQGTMRALYNEAKSSKDVIIEDIPEDFYNMAKKVMIGLQWAHVNFMYDYILKCDDDIFVHLDNLANKLKDFEEHTYFGQAMLGQPVERAGRYGVTKEDHTSDTYDPYCSGGGFVMSHDVIHKMIPLFNWEKPLKIDDAYFGSLAFKTGATAKQGKGFYMWNSDCIYHKDVIVVHPVKTRECMQQMQDNANNNT